MRAAGGTCCVGLGWKARLEAPVWNPSLSELLYTPQNVVYPQYPPINRGRSWRTGNNRKRTTRNGGAAFDTPIPIRHSHARIAIARRKSLAPADRSETAIRPSNLVPSHHPPPPTLPFKFLPSTYDCRPEIEAQIPIETSRMLSSVICQELRLSTAPSALSYAAATHPTTRATYSCPTCPPHMR